jgi:hypothetical protein
MQQAIEIGQRNRDTMELVRNWCVHARVEKFGGVGLIEASTGLPIGHHSMHCDHASEAGMATWDLRDAALDFHDRNCVDCKLRKPIGFPNLSGLLKERDKGRAEEAKRKEQVEAQAANALAARRTRRAQLRENVGPVANAIIDHIEEFDEQRTEENRERICESARLAPEHFAAPLVEYLYDITENELWFAGAGLTVLHELKADSARLARLALLAITYPLTTRTAARILLDSIDHVDSSLISQGLPCIIEMANPSEDRLLLGQRLPPEPELLHRLWRTYPDAVGAGLDRLL